MPLPILRANLPTWAPPDRVQWAAEYGHTPTLIPAVPEGFIRAARLAACDDIATLHLDEAILAREHMQSIEARVAAKILRDEYALVFFDPVEDAFYHYPGVRAHYL